MDWAITHPGLAIALLLFVANTVIWLVFYPGFTEDEMSEVLRHGEDSWRKKRRMDFMQSRDIASEEDEEQYWNRLYGFLRSGIKYPKILWLTDRSAAPIFGNLLGQWVYYGMKDTGEAPEHWWYVSLGIAIFFGALSICGLLWWACSQIISRGRTVP